jgi:hypothetical protein
MFQNIELEIFIMILLLLIIISMVPLIELKYQSDVYENIETFNKYCLNNDINLINELNVKNLYMWNISSYIYDIDNLSYYFYTIKDSYNENDYRDLNRHESISMIDGKSINNIMKIYNNYLNMSLGLFLFLIIFSFTQIFIYINISEYSYFEICLNSDNITIEKCFRHYLYNLFIYILIFIIFFSIILKKITELYADTDTHKYIMLMKELDILLKENISENSEITDILKKYSKYKINEISYATLNNSTVINEIVTVYNKNKNENKHYKNNNNYKITLKNIDKLEYYNSEEAKNKVKNKIDDIFRFIYVYIFLLIVPLYILSISLQGNYIYLLMLIIALLLISISFYNTYNTLHN